MEKIQKQINSSKISKIIFSLIALLVASVACMLPGVASAKGLSASSNLSSSISASESVSQITASNSAGVSAVKTITSISSATDSVATVPTSVIPTVTSIVPDAKSERGFASVPLISIEVPDLASPTIKLPDTVGSSSRDSGVAGPAPVDINSITSGLGRPGIDGDVADVPIDNPNFPPPTSTPTIPTIVDMGGVYNITTAVAPRQVTANVTSNQYVGMDLGSLLDTTIE